MRLLGVLCICASVLGGGVFWGLRQQKRETALSELSSYFGRLALSAENVGGGISAVLRRCAGDAGNGFAFPQTLIAECEQTGDLCLSWARALGSSGLAAALTFRQRELLSAFGNVFSAPSLPVFTEHCRQYAETFGTLYAEAKEKRKREEKLGVTAAALLAALLFILLM